MSKILEVNQNALIETVAKELQQVAEIKPPEWASFVKTGVHKYRPPVRKDWWYVRCAALLRKVNNLGPIGVSKLRRQYGGRKSVGSAPERVYPGSANITRKALQQLGKAGLIKYMEKGVHKGQVITPKGTSLLTKAAKKAAAK